MTPLICRARAACSHGRRAETPRPARRAPDNDLPRADQRHAAGPQPRRRPQGRRRRPAITAISTATSPPRCWRKPASSPATCWRRSTAIGDEHGIKLDAGNVTTAPGWPDAYRRWTEARLERGVGLRKRSAARDCRSRSTPPAPRSGARPTSPSGSARC